MKGREAMNSARQSWYTYARHVVILFVKNEIYQVGQWSTFLSFTATIATTMSPWSLETHIKFHLLPNMVFAVLLLGISIIALSTI